MSHVHVMLNDYSVLFSAIRALLSTYTHQTSNSHYLIRLFIIWQHLGNYFKLIFRTIFH